MKSKKIFSFILASILLLTFNKNVSAHTGDSDILSGYWDMTTALNLDVQLDSQTASIYQYTGYDCAMSWNQAQFIKIKSYGYGEYNNDFTAKIRISGSSNLPSNCRGITSNYVKSWYGYKASMSEGPWHHSVVILSTTSEFQNSSDERKKTMTHEIGHSLGLDDLSYVNNDNVLSVMWQGPTNVPGISTSPTSHDISNLDYKYETTISNPK